MKRLLKIVWNIFEDRLEGNLVQATLGRPLLFILNCCCYEASEAVTAVTMAWDFDRVLSRNVVQARYAFSKRGEDKLIKGLSL